MSNKTKISIVIPVYYNELNLEDTNARLIKLSKENPRYDFEYIYVDDNSGDSSLEMLEGYKKEFPNIVKLLKLTRNFGSMAAIQAGLSISSGDFVGFISADLQDPPELFIEMAENLENDLKVCIAVRKGRKDPYFQKLFAQIFYFLLRKIIFKNYPKMGFDVILVKKEVVQLINKIDEKNVNIMNLIYWMGFPYATIPYTREERKAGKSRWTFSKRLKFFVDSFVGYTYYPMRFMSAFGILFSVGAFIYGVFIVFNKLIGGVDVPGWSTLVVILTFVSGAQMLMLGILGEYLWRGIDESRGRPNFIIDKEY